MTAMEQQIGMMIGACFTFFSPCHALSVTARIRARSMCVSRGGT